MVLISAFRIPFQEEEIWPDTLGPFVGFVDDKAKN